MKQKFTDVVIDTETLGLDDNAVIMSISLVGFNLADGLKSERVSATFNLNIIKQILHGRTLDKNTLEFWAKQSEGTKSYLTSGPHISVYDACDNLHEFFSENLMPEVRIFERRKPFDTGKIANLMKTYGYVPLFQYWQTHEITSYILAIFPDDKKGYVGIEPNVKHYSYYDAMTDVTRLQIAYSMNDPRFRNEFRIDPAYLIKLLKTKFKVSYNGHRKITNHLDSYSEEIDVCENSYLET